MEYSKGKGRLPRTALVRVYADAARLVLQRRLPPVRGRAQVPVRVFTGLWIDRHE